MIDLLDILVMLLSTDWFAPHWAAIGIDLHQSSRDSIRKGCREIVAQIVGEAKEYWLTSFSDNRRKQTKTLLESLIRDNRSDAIMVEPVTEWEGMSDGDLKAGSLFDNLTEELLSGNAIGRIAIPAPEIIERISVQREKQITWDVDFGELCIGSRSPWDRHIRQLTPDLPAFLADMLASFVRARRFKLLWASVRQDLTAKQIDQLAAWYRRVAKLRAQRDIAPSYFHNGSEAFLT